jgi:multiple sugar transport system permease protein
MTRLSNRTLLLFLSPALLMLVLFTLLPAIWAAYVSFTDLALAGPKAMDYSFLGLRNYVKLFRDTDFHHSILLSVEYTILTNIGQFVIGLTAALILSRRKLWGQNFLLAVIVLPMVIPGIMQATIWSSMFGSGDMGTLNRFVGLFGVEPMLWLRATPMFAIVLVNFWNNAGFAMILFLAGLENIPKEVIESATIDGANGWQMLTRIKLPLIRYVVMLWLLLNTIGCLGMFDLVFALTRGGPGNATELLGIYIYNQGFQFFELGYGSAAAMIMLLISLGFAFIYMRLMRVEL